MAKKFGFSVCHRLFLFFCHEAFVNTHLFQNTKLLLQKQLSSGKLPWNCASSVISRHMEFYGLHVWALCVLQANRPVWSGVSGWGVPPVSAVDEGQRHHWHPGPHLHRQWGGLWPGQHVCVCVCMCLSMWMKASARNLHSKPHAYGLLGSLGLAYCSIVILWYMYFHSNKLSMYCWLMTYTVN